MSALAVRGQGQRAVRATTAQRRSVCWWMRQLELDIHTITLMHRPHLEAAGLLCDVGQGMDELVGQLTRPQASALIHALSAALAAREAR